MGEFPQNLEIGISRIGYGNPEGVWFSKLGGGGGLDHWACPSSSAKQKLPQKCLETGLAFWIWLGDTTKTMDYGN